MARSGKARGGVPKKGKNNPVVSSGFFSGRTLAYGKSAGEPGAKKKKKSWWAGPPLIKVRENEWRSSIRGTK